MRLATICVLACVACRASNELRVTLPARIQQGLSSFDALRGRIELYEISPNGATSSATTDGIASSENCMSLTGKPSKTFTIDVTQKTNKFHADGLDATEYVFMVTFEDVRKSTGHTVPLIQSCAGVNIVAKKNLSVNLDSDDGDATFDNNQNGLTNLEDILAGHDPEAAAVSWKLQLPTEQSDANTSHVAAFADGTIIYNGIDPNGGHQLYGAVSASGTALWQKSQVIDSVQGLSLDLVHDLVIAVVGGNGGGSGAGCSIEGWDPTTPGPTIKWTQSLGGSNGCPDAAPAIAPNGSIWFVNNNALTEITLAGNTPTMTTHVSLPNAGGDGTTAGASGGASAGATGGTIGGGGGAIKATAATFNNTWIGASHVFYQGQWGGPSCPNNLCDSVLGFDLTNPNNPPWNTLVTGTAPDNLAISPNDTVYGTHYISQAPTGSLMIFSPSNGALSTSTVTLTTDVTLLAPGQTTIVTSAKSASQSAGLENLVSPAVLDANDIAVRAGTSLIVYDAGGTEKYRFNVGDLTGTPAGQPSASIVSGKIALEANNGLGAGHLSHTGLWVFSADGSTIVTFYGGVDPQSEIAQSASNLVFATSGVPVPVVGEAPYPASNGVQSGGNAGTAPMWLYAVPLPSR